MSSESPRREGLPPPAGPSGDGGRGFRTTATILVASLVVAVAVLTVANVVRGPAVLRADVDAATAVQRTGQRLLLHFDQVIGDVPPGAVTVQPQVPISFTAEPSRLSVRFDAVLRYATTYRVSVPVESTATGSRATASYAFRTPDPVTYLLRRHSPAEPPGTEDEIVRTAAGGGAEVVDRAPGIEEYAVSGDSILRVTSRRDRADTVTLTSLAGDRPARTVVDNAYVSQLHGDGPRGLFGFLLTPDGEETNPQLQLYDPSGAGTVVAVRGLDGSPVEAQDWAFVPGTSSVLVQLADGSCYVLDPLGGTPGRPLGVHVALEGFLRNSATALFKDPGAYTAVDLVTGGTTRLPEPDAGAERSLSQLFGSDDGGYVGLLTGMDGSSHVVGLREGALRTLYTPDPAGSRIPRVCASPNGQLVAAQVVLADAVSDEYARMPDFVGTETVFLEASTGQVLERTRGFAADWCG